MRFRRFEHARAVQYDRYELHTAALAGRYETPASFFRVSRFYAGSAFALEEHFVFVDEKTFIGHIAV